MTVDVLIKYRFNGLEPGICRVVKPVGGVVFIHQVVSYYIMAYVVIGAPIY